MHFKRRRRRAGRVVLFVLAAVLLAALGTGMWLLWPRAMRRDMPSAAAPQGTLRGLRLSWSYPTSAGGLSSGGPEVLDTLFADAAAYAQAHGLNALFLDVADAELSSIAFRDRAYETWPGAAADDSLFHKYDPLRALCEQASQAGLAVYAVTPELSGNADWEAALARMQKKYAVAGLYVEGSALFDSISRQAVFYADEAAFNDPSSLFLASLDTDGFHGAVFDYARCRAQPEAFSVLASALDGSAARPALLEYTPGGTLAVSYPADGAAVYTSACFVMGTSDPAQELLLNGTPVESRGPGGTFGVLVDVAEGSNVYTLTQGGTSVSVTVNRPAPAGGGSGGPTEVPHDDTAEVEPGTPVRIRNWIASLLYDPASDGNISETVRQGAVATVAACTETLRGGKRTWAYQLASGDFVLAYNAEPLPPETPRASFTGAAAAATDTGEVLTFAGGGTPLAYTNMVDGALVMDFYDADFAADFAVSGSALVQSAAVDPGDGCTRVTLTFTQPVWGHTVEYADGTTQVILKKQPVRSDVFGKPLTGVAVLLDAGHGDHDPGAMGAAGAGAPAEKDVNLALTLAAKYRLEQLGATVQTIRTDDSFLSLEERNRAIVAGQPDFFIAVHHNSIDLSVDANLQTGTECYYFYPAGKALAQALVRNVTQATSRPDRGAQWGYYYVTRSTVCPAVLLEAGFMVNPSEYENVTSEPQLWAAGDAIARSVLECVPPG